MKSVINHEKAFLSLFSQTARYHHRHQVFEDFVSCSVIALQNSLQFCDKREEKYMRIVGRYEKTDISRMAQLLAHVTNGLDETPGDFLGRVFMQLELGDKYRGQFFTPWDIGLMMARMQLGNVEDNFRDKPFITLSEPAAPAVWHWHLPLFCVRLAILLTGICGSLLRISIRWRPVWRISSFRCLVCRGRW